MIRLLDVEVPAAVLDKLLEYQSDVDAAGDYSARVQRAKERFKARNKQKNGTFDAIKRALTAMCCGAQRCAYCEDSAADEVEHIQPKSLYPELAFSWPNFLYACGPCNNAKNDHFAVFPDETATVVNVTRPRGAPIIPPIPGSPVFLNPRLEEATRWLTLDILGSFHFVATADKGSRAFERARFTIETLSLNRGTLAKARKEAFTSYLAHLHRYVTAKRDAASLSLLADIRDTITRRQHPTVWREMQRRHDKHPDLKPLFASAPEAASW